MAAPKEMIQALGSLLCAGGICDAAGAGVMLPLLEEDGCGDDDELMISDRAGIDSSCSDSVT